MESWANVGFIEARAAVFYAFGAGRSDRKSDDAVQQEMSKLQGKTGRLTYGR